MIRNYLHTPQAISKKSGSALLITITITALLTIIVVEQLHNAWLQSSLVASFKNKTVALYKARAGIVAAKRILQDQTFDDQTTKYQLLEIAKIGIPISVEDDQVLVQIVDETGKISINSLVSGSGLPNSQNIALFKRLLSNLDLDENLADAAVDWIDNNDEPFEDGAESDYYESLDPPYKAKNMKLDSIAEIGMIKGFKREVIMKLAPYITIYSNGKVNINSSSKEVLMALNDNLTESMATEIISNVTTEAYKNKSDLNKIVGISSIYPEISNLIDVNGSWFLVTAIAQENETKKIITAVMKKESNVYIKYYKTL
ncbi:MAG: type II secretion system minor pseudopilin GspK [Nitrospinota bacterium]